MGILTSVFLGCLLFALPPPQHLSHPQTLVTHRGPLTNLNKGMGEPLVLSSGEKNEHDF